MSKKLALIAVFVMSLTACSSLNPANMVVDALTPNQGISVDAQNGDREINAGETDNSQTNVDDNEGTVTISNQKAENQFQQAHNVTVENIPLSFYLVSLLGWLAPSPSNIWRETKSTIKGIFDYFFKH